MPVGTTSTGHALNSKMIARQPWAELVLSFTVPHFRVSGIINPLGLIRNWDYSLEMTGKVNAGFVGP